MIIASIFRLHVLPTHVGVILESYKLPMALDSTTHTRGGDPV